MDQLTDTEATPIIHKDTDADGAVRRVDHVKGTTTEVTRDRARRLTQIATNRADGAISAHASTLDATGNRTAVADTLLTTDNTTRETRTTSYTHDRLGRLTGESGTNGTLTYGYDNRGNRTQRVIDGVTHGYTYDLADRIQSGGVGGGTAWARSGPSPT